MRKVWYISSNFVVLILVYIPNQMALNMAPRFMVNNFVYVNLVRSYFTVKTMR